MIGTNLGISEKSIGLSTKILNHTLADQSVLLMKTRKAHWDIRGPQFYSLHLLWEQQYEKLQELVDEIAERVRMLGQYPIGTLGEAMKESSLTEDTPPFIEATQAVTSLNRDHEELCRMLREGVAKLESVASEDAGTIDLLTRVLEEHEKMAWMLGAFLEGGSSLETSSL
jgi:starvation-inducible DNA-binding protein